MPGLSQTIRRNPTKYLMRGQHAGLTYAPGGLGPSPREPCTLRGCFRSRPSNPLYKRGCVPSPIQNGPLLADVNRASAEVYDAERPYYAHVMVSAIGPEAPRIKYPNRSGLGTRGNEQRLTKDVTPSRGLAARAKNARPRLVFISRAPLRSTRLHITRHEGTRGYPSGPTRL